MLWTLVGVVAFAAVVILLKDHRQLSRYGYVCGLVGLMLLAVPGAPARRGSRESNGAKIWIRFPGFSIQPAEFSKILLLIFFASVLVSKRNLFASAGKHVLGMDLPRPRDLAPLLAAWIISVGVMIFEKDLGTSLLLYASFLVMVYIATDRFSWVVIGWRCSPPEALRRITFSATSGFVCRTGWIRSPIRTVPATRWCNRCSASPPAGCSAPGWATDNPARCPRRPPTSSSQRSVRSSAWSVWPGVLMLYTIVVIRGMRTAIAVRDSFGKLLAAGLWRPPWRSSCSSWSAGSPS